MGFDRENGNQDHGIHQVLMANTARVPVLFIHEPANDIPVGFW
jgi:hypothetical protein